MLKSCEHLFVVDVEPGTVVFEDFVAICIKCGLHRAAPRDEIEWGEREAILKPKERKERKEV